MAWLRSRYSLEAALTAGGLMILVGVVIDGTILYRWLLEPGREMEQTIHLAFVATTIMVLGVNVLFNAFLLNLIMEDQHTIP